MNKLNQIKLIQLMIWIFIMMNNLTVLKIKYALTEIKKIKDPPSNKVAHNLKKSKIKVLIPSQIKSSTD
jgi:hypothetical protein